MENPTIVSPAEAAAVAGGSSSAGSSGNGSSVAATRLSLRGQLPLGQGKRIARYRADPLPGLEKMEPGVHVYPEGYTPPPAGSLSGNSSSLPFYLQPGFGFRAASYEPPPRITSPETTDRFPPAFATEIRVFQTGSRELAEAEARCNRELLQEADKLEQEDEDGFDTEEAKVAFRAFKAKFAGVYRHLASSDSRPLVYDKSPPTDTQEEHLTAEEMEMRLCGSERQVCHQARHFATLALGHYNTNKKTHKFELGTVLLSKCFSEADGTTFAHVNFTAAPEHSPTNKRLFFAELMLIPDLQAYEGMEPMSVLNVCTIDDSCFGGCHEIERDIKEPVRKNLDYDRCHACSDRIKHPRGDRFIAGHDRTKTPYVNIFAWTYK